jgi:ABC-type Fe3+-hydroxamate transport system substrate-binding protein
MQLKKLILFVGAILFAHIGIAQDSKTQKIISLAPSLTKSLYYLGADNLLTGHTTYCHIAKNDNKETVASAVKVNLEKVISLRPDLVIATTITNPETIEFLKKAGIRTEIFPTAKSFEEICTQFERLGSVIGKGNAARTIVSEARAKVKEISSGYNFSEPPVFFFQIGAKPLYTVLRNTFLDDYITFSGGANLAGNISYPTISREFVLSQNPDIIIIVTMGIVGQEEKKLWESYVHLNAVKNNRVFIIDSDIACTPTPVDFVKTMEIISELLQ